MVLLETVFKGFILLIKCWLFPKTPFYVFEFSVGQYTVVSFFLFAIFTSRYQILVIFIYKNKFLQSSSYVINVQCFNIENLSCFGSGLNLVIKTMFLSFWRLQFASKSFLYICTCKADLMTGSMSCSLSSSFDLNY